MPFYRGAEKEFPNTSLDKLAPVCFELHRAWGTFRRFGKYTDSTGASWSRTYFKKFWSALNTALKRKGGTGCTKLRGLTETSSLESLCTALAMKDDELTSFEDAEYFTLCDGTRLTKDELKTPEQFQKERIGQIFVLGVEEDNRRKFMTAKGIPIIEVKSWPKEMSYLAEASADPPQNNEDEGEEEPEPVEQKEELAGANPDSKVQYTEDEDTIDIMVRIGDGISVIDEDLRSEILKGLPASITDKIRFVWDFGSVKQNIKPFSWFSFMKPLNGYRNREAFGWKPFLEVVSRASFPLVAQKLFNGVRVQIHKNGDSFEFLTDDGHHEVRGRLPTFMEELKKDKWPEKLIMDGVVEMWKNGKHQGRDATYGFLSHYEDLFKGEDKHIVVNIFDLLYVNEDDLTEVPYVDRLKLLDELPFEQTTDKVPKTGIFNRVPNYMVTQKPQVLSVGKKLSNLPASRGTIFKSGQSLYKLDGLTGHWYLYKNNATYNVRILQKLPTNTPLVYTYKIGLRIDDFDLSEEDKVWIDENSYAYAGKTLTTSQSFYEGSTVRVTAKGVVQYKNRIRMQGVKPLRSIRDPTDSVEDVFLKAEDAKVLMVKSDLAGDWPPEDKEYGYMVLNDALYVDIGPYMEKLQGGVKTLMTKENFKPQGLVEHGVRNETTTEYFFVTGPMKDKHLKCKWVDGKWVCNTADKYDPTVLSDLYIPPKGFSALPSSIKNAVPKQFRYWEYDKPDKRLSIRDAYVRARGVKLTAVRSFDDNHYLIKDLSGKRYLGVSSGKLDGEEHTLDSFEEVVEADSDEREFTLIKHWWKGERAQSHASEHFDLFLDDEMWVMDGNPDESKVQVQSRRAYSKSFKDDIPERSVLIKPGDSGNSTKDTPAWAERVDKGLAVVVEDTDTLKRFRLSGKGLSGYYTMTRPDPDENMWTLTKEKMQKRRVRQSMQLAVNNYWMEGNTMVVEGVALSYGVWNGDFYSWEVVSESASLPAKDNLLGKPVSVSPGRVMGPEEHENAEDEGKVVKLWIDEDKKQINVRVHILTEQGQDLVKEGHLNGFSVEIDVIEDPERRIIEEIVHYDRVTMVERPACRVCTFDLCEIPAVVS